jgi:dTMP kinase
VTSPQSAALQRGLFVAFEGGDGAGKTTQVTALRDWLTEQGYDVLVTRQPGGTDLGRAIRDLVLHGEHVSPRAEALLFAADKAHHADTLVRPALDAGRMVITDRYTDSSIAYQGAGRDLGVAEITRLQHWAVADLLPDLTVVLDVSPDVGRLRRGSVHDRLERERDEFHARVRQHFLDIAAADPSRYLVLDAGAPPHDLAAAVRERMAPLLTGSAAESSR